LIWTQCKHQMFHFHYLGYFGASIKPTTPRHEHLIQASQHPVVKKQFMTKNVTYFFSKTVIFTNRAFSCISVMERPPQYDTPLASPPQSWCTMSRTLPRYGTWASTATKEQIKQKLQPFFWFRHLLLVQHQKYRPVSNYLNSKIASFAALTFFISCFSRFEMLAPYPAIPRMIFVFFPFFTSTCPGLSSVPANKLPSITVWAPAARAFVMSPEVCFFLRKKNNFSQSQS
jgi:hypothetical protein